MLNGPPRDPYFAGHPVHGSSAQRVLFDAAVRECKQFNVAVDIGAHIGIWAAMMAVAFNTVVAFEPVSENYKCLVGNTCGFGNVWTARLAIGDRFGVYGMVLPSEGNSGCWHITDGADVRMVPLDSLELDGIGLIKMDVEGAEGLVVHGGRDLLARCRPVVVLEDNGLGPKYFGAEWRDPKLMLHELSYHCSQRMRKDEIWIPN